MAIRSFFAVPLSVESEQQLAEACGLLRERMEYVANPEAGIRWIPSQSYHLTLAFLGDIESRAIQVLHDVAQQVTAQARASTFVLNRFEWFPSALKPKLLVAAPAPSEPLQQLQKQLTRSLRQQGFHLEKRSFRPHITLARLKNFSQPFDLSEEPLAIPCELDELVLFSSTQGRNKWGESGSVYSPLLVEPISAYPKEHR